VGDRVMLGFGGAVRYLGPYPPLDRLDATYDPGDELLVAAGFDVRVSRTSAWSVDAAYTFYGTDDFDGTETIAPGDRWVLTSQVRTRSGRRDLRALVRYVGRDRSTVPSPVDDGAVRSVPNSVLGQVELALPLGPTTRVLVQGGGLHYTETSAANVAAWTLSDARTLGRVGGGLDLRLGSAVHWRPQATVTVGDVQSVSARMGIVWRH
jgi:hypothetical protein